MDYRYKIIISNRNLYKEIELTPATRQVKVGTGVNCDVRLRKSLFFGDIELLFTKNEDEWSIICADNLYLTEGDVRKLMTKQLNHGDILEVRYNDSGNSVFFVEFIIDFDNGSVAYDRVVDISNANQVTIGCSASSNISINSLYTRNEAIKLGRQNGKVMLQILHASYGVHHNGRKAGNLETIKDGDFFTLADFFFCYNNGRLWMQIRDDMRINGLQYSDIPTRNNYPLFKRSTRVKAVLSDESIEILEPPPKPEKPKNNLLMRLLPSMGMLIAAGVMAALGGTTMIIFSGISGGMAILTSILGFREGKKEYREKSAERIEKYNAYIANKRAEIEQLRDEELRLREDIYISQDAEQKMLDAFSYRLFEREKTDEDFLDIRVGNGAVEAKRKINYKEKERLEIEDELQLYPEQLCEEYKYIHDAPVVCHLKDAGAIGVVGSEEDRFCMLKNIVIDLAARQYYTDIKFVFAASEEHQQRIHWLRMLPHVYCDDTKSRLLVCDDESKNLIFEYIYKVLSQREQRKAWDEHIIVFLYDDCGFQKHPISKFVGNAKDLGVTFIFFGEKTSDIPMGCSNLIMLRDRENGTLVDTSGKDADVDFRYPHISSKAASHVVRLLAPVYTEEISLESTLTKNISMFQLLNILAVDDIDLAGNWEKSQIVKSMAAPIGVSKSGIVSLDLHDKAHGPHGLVAGTTGSGKSEILQTYILSMAILYHPYEVGFVIIDFKGGGMVNQFRNLPHLVGAITNIDGKEIDRSLRSIKAELQRRQRYFAEADVNHIDKYIRKFKAGEVSEPLSHLIIIVDEFAELKAEQPEFMKELISAARIGRSLGVHLILATQKPSGQVNEQIWSNSRFKLCLKVQNQEDSNEVLKSPLAAEIKEPGRAYLQVGNNEIFELFQSAYSGASEKAEEGNVREFTIYSLNDSGRRTPVYVQKKNKSDEANTTQLDAIVDYIHGYCESNGVRKLPDICLPSLAHVIDFPPELPHSQQKSIDIPIGVYDDPDNQYQGVYSIDISSSNVMIIGSAQSGKTNILQSMIRYLSTYYSPEEVSIYIIDFASMTLKNFEKLNHVGGVVCSSDDEKLKNLFKLLNNEIQQRKAKLMSVGVSSFAAYREAGGTDIPQLVLMIDNITALKELYFKDDDSELINLCREGISVGLSIVVANAQTQGISYRYLSNFSTRIAMFCNDSSEYGSLFDHCRERVDNIPGRCLVVVEKRKLDCQAYIAFPGEKEIERVNKMRNYVSETNKKYEDSLAKWIPVIPDTLTSGYVNEELGSYMSKDYTLIAGLDYATVSPLVMDFTALGVLGISGREKSGKHNWIKYAVNMLHMRNPGGLRLYVSDGISKKLSCFKEAEYTASYSILETDAPAQIMEIEKKLEARYEALLRGEEDILTDAPLLLYIIDNPDAADAICNDRDALNAYKNITSKYKNMKAGIIVSGLENASISYSANDILKGIKDKKNLLFFDDLANLKIFDLSYSLTKQFKKQIELGDGYYIKDNDCYKLKTPLYTNMIGGA